MRNVVVTYKRNWVTRIERERMNDAYLAFSGLSQGRLPSRTMPDPDSRRGKYVTLFESDSTRLGFSHTRLRLHFPTQRSACSSRLLPITSRLPMTRPSHSCPKFFFLSTLCLLPLRGAFLQQIILGFRISVTGERQCSYLASFRVLMMLCVNGMRHHRHHCSTLRTFFFPPSPPSPRNASPKSVCCKVRLTFSFSSIKLILSSVILTSTLAVQGGVRTPLLVLYPIFFSCFHSDIVTTSSHIL